MSLNRERRAKVPPLIIRDAIAQAAADLKKAGIETPTLDVSLLLAHVLNSTRASLTARAAEPLPDENISALHALIQRRLNGECVAYITGKKEFWGLEFSVNNSVLVPRPDTETLVEAAIKILGEWRIENREWGMSGAIRILDLCTGCGTVAIALKSEMPALEVHATDISKDALEIAKTNARRLLGENKIHFHLSDLYNNHSPLSTVHSPFPTPHSPFSLIVSNPPYVSCDKIKTLSADVQKEPRLALNGGKEGLDIITRIIDGSAGFLQRGGCLLLEADPRQMERIFSLLAERGFCDIKLYRDLSGQERVIGGILKQ